MPFVPFNNTIRLDVIFVQDGQRVENVHHFIVDETPDVATAASLCEAYKTWWVNNLRSSIPTNVSLVEIIGTIMENENDPVVSYTTGLPVAGTSGGHAMPNSVTVAVKLNTAYRGRSYRGRTYYIGLVEEQIDDNKINNTFAATLKGWYEDLMALSVDVGPAVLGVASKYSHKALRQTGVITPVTSVTVDQYIDSQRRRLPGRGR